MTVHGVIRGDSYVEGEGNQWQVVEVGEVCCVRSQEVVIADGNTKSVIFARIS